MIEERRYTKRELARLYWPKTKNIKSAMKNLREDVGNEKPSRRYQQMPRTCGGVKENPLERE